MPTTIRKTLKDELITNLSTLTHQNGTDLLFAEVVKIPIDDPDSLPAIQVLDESGGFAIDGLDFDNRNINFRLVVWDMIEASGSQVEADRRVDRLSDIEDMLLDHFEQIPQPYEDAIGVHIFRVDVPNVNYNTIPSKNGIEVIMTMDISFLISRPVRGL